MTEYCDRAYLKGKRGEEVSEWFFRLNGFFLISSYVIHPDQISEKPRTEVDLVGLRLKKSQEGIFRNGVKPTIMEDCDLLVKTPFKNGNKHLIGIVEVTTQELPKINGPMSNPKNENVNRLLSRVGCCENRTEVFKASESLYQNYRYENEEFLIQYFCIAKKKRADWEKEKPQLIQITFDEIAEFLYKRFKAFPEKRPQNLAIELWSGFGKSFLEWFNESRTQRDCKKALNEYLENGNLDNV